jgi:hypothetical protein
MTEIPLASEYVAAVLRGQKTTTIRAGRRSYQRGQAAFVAGTTRIPIEITGTRTALYSELEHADAVRDGFLTLDALNTALRSFYRDIRDDSPVTIVAFRVVPGSGLAPRI